ncbi:DMT family transporter [Thermococcus sp. AM4]|uniref:DMT family transporter n=1 Tax=Thermococcus sp. (strain AM4) TaxID=246969 RepID=UPI0001871051|nr:DMT family transporter [Thermococcus sp. AM4]EEB73467.1 Permease, DMT superfamily [Thermococcus sp. AM4]
MSKKHAIGAVLLWSTVASAFKLSLLYMSPLQLLFWAFLTSLVLYGALYFRSFRPSRENLRSAYLGLVLFLYYTVLFSAYDLLPAQEAQALNYTWPLALVLLSVPLLKRKLALKTLFGLFLGFLGALIVATRGRLLSLGFSNPVGDALGLGSALIWAAYWLLNVRDGRRLEEKMFWNFLFGFTYVSIAVVATGNFAVPPVEGLAGAIYVGLFEMGVTYLLWYRAVESDVAFASNLAYLVPFLSLLFIALILGERIEPTTVLGLVLIVGGILLGREQ